MARENLCMGRRRGGLRGNGGGRNANQLRGDHWERDSDLESWNLVLKGSGAVACGREEHVEEARAAGGGGERRCGVPTPTLYPPP